jgi:hypothetical protein
MLIPYFTSWMILSVYGMHRYEIIRTYFKHRKKATGSRPALRAAAAGHHPAAALQRALRGGAADRRSVKIEYPRELLQIQVLDDSTDDTAPFRRSAGGALPHHGLSHRIPSPRPTAMASRPARCRKA